MHSLEEHMVKYFRRMVDRPNIGFQAGINVSHTFFYTPWGYTAPEHVQILPKDCGWWNDPGSILEAGNCFEKTK